MMKEVDYAKKVIPTPANKVVKDYKSKQYRIVIAPSGHQFVDLDTDSLLKLNGFSNVTEAKKAGWKFNE